MLELGPHRGVVERAVGPQGPGKRPPAYGEVETGRIGVQPGTSSGQARTGIGDKNALDHDDTHQVGAAATNPASDAGAHRGAREGTGDRATGRG